MLTLHSSNTGTAHFEPQKNTACLLPRSSQLACVCDFATEPLVDSLLQDKTPVSASIYRPRAFSLPRWNRARFPLLAVERLQRNRVVASARTKILS